jgi:hypothetical protein
MRATGAWSVGCYLSLVVSQPENQSATVEALLALARSANAKESEPAIFTLTDLLALTPPAIDEEQRARIVRNALAIWDNPAVLNTHPPPSRTQRH